MLAVSQQNTRRARRAMSADQALTRAQERNYRKVDAAVASGLLPKLQRNMNVTLKTATGGSIKLVSADGSVTAEGKYYYNDAGVDPPSVFAYEQPLEQGKWVKGFDGKKKLVRVMGSDGHWHPTKLGLQYFKYNRDEYTVEYPVRLARPAYNHSKKNVHEWVLDRQTFAYMPHGEDFTVGQIKESGRLALESNKEAHVRNAANQYIQTSQTIQVTDPETGEEGPYHVVVYDSPLLYVWDPTRPIRVTVARRHVYNQSRPTADEILERPLRHFFVVPDGCYRPWDLHPLSLVRDGRCAVTMLHECFTKRTLKEKTWENGRWKFKTGYTRSMTEEQIEDELDIIFDKLQYKGDEYPFEKGWRQDGCTSKMILEFCKTHSLTCRIYKDSVAKGNELDCYIPQGNSRIQVNFFVRDDHCFWYGKPLEEKGICKESAANHGIALMWDKCNDAVDRDDDDFDMAELIDQFCDKETMCFFRKADATPPFAEWRHASELLDAAPDFEQFHEPPENRWSHGTKPKLYFWHADLLILEPHLRNKLKPGQVTCKYGPSPDKPTVLVVNAAECPLFIVRQVPLECELYQAIFDKAAEMLHLHKGKQLVYRGESASQVAERLRLEVSRASRHEWTDTERKTILARQNNQCECGAELADHYEIDHVVRLCDGGKDCIDNANAKCVICHAEKSEMERLGAVYPNPLESHLSAQTLEGFLDAPKPGQLMYGDGSEDCVKVDAIRCRVNALLHNMRPLPVASITDEIKPYPVDATQDPHEFCVEADYYYIDAGEPLDGPLEGLPYMGPRWYWVDNADAVIIFGESKQGKVYSSHAIMTFTASGHAPADSLVKPYADIERIVQATMKDRLNPHPWPVGSEPKPYTSKEIQAQPNNLLRAMQGAWTSQAHCSWECVSSLYEESCPGPVHMWRPNADGTKRFMTRTDLLTNRTLFLIGRIALDVEHLLLFKLYYRLKQLPRPPSIHGSINDCLYLRATPPWASGVLTKTPKNEKCQDAFLPQEGGQMIETSMEADEANDKMAQQVEDLLAEHPRLSWDDDGSPMFRVEKHVTTYGHGVVAL